MQKILFLIFTVLVILAPVWAEEPGFQSDGSPVILTLEDALRLGLAENNSLKTGASSLAGKQRLLDDSWNVFLPDVSATLSLSRSNEPQLAAGRIYAGTNNPVDPSSYSVEDGVYDYLSITSYEQEISPWTVIGNISAQLVLSPALFNGVRQLELDYRKAALDLEGVRIDTEKNIKKNFYNLLLLEEQIDVLKKNIAATEDRLESMEELYKNGYVSELDLLNTRAGLASLGPALLRVENGYEQLKMVFLMDLGLELDRQVILEGEVEAAPGNWDADHILNSYLGKRIDVQQLTVAGQMLENAESAAVNQGLMPALALNWTYSPYQLDPFNAEAWTDGDLSGDRGSFSISLSLPVENWIPHSSTSNKILDARDEIERLGYQKELALKGAELEIRSLVMSLNTSRESLLVLADSVEINRKSLAKSREAYDNGRLSLLDLQSSENEFLQAELDLVSEKYSYISSLLSLEAAVNTNLAE